MSNDRSESLNSIQVRELLEFYSELGLTETINEEPINRFELAKKINQESNLKKINTNLAKTELIPKKSAIHVATALANKSTTIDQLRSSLATFEFCDLRKGARNFVFGDGNTNAPVMIIGDAPNPLEDREGKPFVGEEGDLLDKMFDAIGYSRYSKTEKSIYMSSLIPWRPLHTQSSIKPEVEMLLPFIKKHIEIINPKFLVFMGNDPLDSLLQDITENKKPGTWTNFLDIDSLIMHHPKYLIKNPSAKKEAWKDLLLLKEKLHDV